MKKSSKKIPKSHLPKYEGGGSNFNEFGFNVEGQGQGSSTQNIYNQKRAQETPKQSSIGASNYAAAAGAGIAGGTNMMNTYKNPDATVAEGWMAGANTGANVVSSFGPWGQVLGMGIKGTNMIGDKARTGFFEKANADGSLKNPRLAEAAAFTNTVANPLTWGSMINKGIYTPRKYRDTVEQENKDRIAQENTMYARNGGQMFPMGGMNMQPNAEVELEENTLNPDGSTTQYDGASHEQGGIPTNLDAGTLIFSDKLKMGGKTFAKLNKPNMTSKEDKILSDNKASAMSKLTANLMKQAKNKSSVELFEAQEALKQSKLDSYTKRLGGIMKYPDGGITPQQYKQAQSDSLTLYNSGLKSNIPNFEQNNNYTDAFLRLNDLNKRPPVPTNNVDPYSRTTTSTYIKPTMLPYREENFKKGSGIEKIENYAKPVGKPVNHPNYNQFIPGINQSKQPIQIEEFKKGGKKGNTYTPRVKDANDSEDIVVPGNYPKTYQDFSGVLAPSPYDKQMDITDANTLNKSAWEVDYMNNPNAPKPNSNTSEQSNKFDWKGLGTQAAYFAANNAGNIYDLARANKVENTKFQRTKANLLDDSAAMRDANEQTRRAEYNVRGASGGNAGTYLSNRVGLNAQNIMTKDRIRQQYANANAGISNQVDQVNTGIANQEYIANEQNRANARSTKQSAIASVGSNSANQMNDIRNTKMDKKKLDGLIKMYPALAKDPKMLEYFMSFNA